MDIFERDFKKILRVDVPVLELADELGELTVEPDEEVEMSEDESSLLLLEFRNDVVLQVAPQLDVELAVMVELAELDEESGVTLYFIMFFVG